MDGLLGECPEQVRADVRLLFDRRYYEEQLGDSFADEDGALLHYLQGDATSGHDPHPLFDTEHYIRQRPAGIVSGVNPLLHFLTAEIERIWDPNPYFDSLHYVEQMAKAGVRENPLAHYVRHAPVDEAFNPNPLFGNGFYLRMNPDVQAAGLNPFEHYLRNGWKEGRVTSRLIQALIADVGSTPRRALLRGRSRLPLVLVLARGGTRHELVTAGEALARERSLETLVVVVERPERLSAEHRRETVVLEDYAPGAALSKPPAVRLLAKMLGALAPRFALTDVPAAVDGLFDTCVPAYLLLDGSDALSPSELEHKASRVMRVVFTAMKEQDAPAPLPPNVVARPFPPSETDGLPPRLGDVDAFVGSLVDLAGRDLGVGRHAPPASASAPAAVRKVLVPCADWCVSGVNTALEGVGQELRRLGWEVELLFTRDEAAVRASAAGSPLLPYRFLDRRRSGVEGMWEALIAELETSAPCVVLTGYDFVANSILPALTEAVGVVMWVQADDGDYYEQVHRLGRYCNAIVCVSELIRERVAGLEPTLSDRLHVVHNTSVSDRDIVARRGASVELSIAYEGRLVQYQKRVFDFVELADALDRRGEAFLISLIGAFPEYEAAALAFRQRAAHHLESGRIRLLGTLPRVRRFAELAAHDFFVLLSDFEGFPLSLVEAMACGCVPVVADIRSGIPEIVDPGVSGVVMRHRDYDEWAAVVASLWRDPPRLEAMAAAARETVTARFTAAKVATHFDEVLQSVAMQVAENSFRRPPAVHWGEQRSPTGDVLPPPSLYRPVNLPGLA